MTVRALRSSLLAGCGFATLLGFVGCSSNDTTNGTSTSSDGGADDASFANDATSPSSGDGSAASDDSGQTIYAAGDGGVAPTQSIVDAANAFLAALTSIQRTTANLVFTQATAETWTNLPGGNRNGVQYEDMTADAQTAALALAEAALSTAGSTELNNIRNADSVIASTTTSNSGWGAGLTHFAILGTPSLTGLWMIQICAHHLVYNILFNANAPGATPVFLGTEPPNWTLLSDGGTLVTGDVSGSTVSFVNGQQTTAAVDTTGGTSYAALEPQRAAVDALLTALLADTANATAAKLSGSFSDVVYGINATTGGDFNYPFAADAGDTLVWPSGTTGRGVLYSSLTSAEQADVKTAIEAWVNTQESGLSTPLLAAYESDTALAETYVGYGAPTSGTPSFMANPNLQENAATNQQGSYIRIDGPRVLIEFVVQEAVAFRNQGWVHYHSIWRDKEADYGAEFKTGITVDAGSGSGGGGGAPPGGDGGMGGGQGGEGGPGGP